VSTLRLFGDGVLTANDGIAVQTTRHPLDRRNDNEFEKSSAW